MVNEFSYFRITSFILLWLVKHLIYVFFVRICASFLFKLLRMEYGWTLTQTLILEHIINYYRYLDPKSQEYWHYTVDKAELDPSVQLPDYAVNPPREYQSKQGPDHNKTFYWLKTKCITRSIVRLRDTDRSLSRLRNRSESNPPHRTKTRRNTSKNNAVRSHIPLFIFIIIRNVYII